MKNVSPSSQTAIGFLLLVYWIPLFILSAYASPRKGWTVFFVGLLVSTLGGICFWLLIRQREQKIKKQIQNIIDSLPKEKEISALPSALPHIDEEKLHVLEKTLEMHERKQLENLRLLEDKQHLLFKTVKENECYQVEVDNLKQELDTVKHYLNEEVAHYKSLIMDHQKTIADLREAVHSKQQVTTQLESKVRDLSYEIKTILQIAEGPRSTISDTPLSILAKESPPAVWENENREILSFQDALMLLKKSLDSAQRMSGASHFSKSQRFKDLPFENYALDLRRLFDHFQHEVEGILFVYSPQEEKMLFVTEQIYQLLGISGEKFIKTFPEISHEFKEEWGKAINQLSFKNESKVILLMKTSAGTEMAVTCVLGVIPTGPFRNHVLGVLFSDANTYTGVVV